MVIDDVVIRENEINASEEEIQNYIDYIRKNKVTDGQLIYLNLKNDNDGKVELNYGIKHEKFERIRRITGYLVGTTYRWNNAKRAEEHDRVKHD